MNEPQRLRLERDLASARRAIYRAVSAAEGMALYDLEEELRATSLHLGEVMSAVMRKRERIPEHLSLRAYLYSNAEDDHTTASRQPLRPRQA